MFVGIVVSMVAATPQEPRQLLGERTQPRLAATQRPNILLVMTDDQSYESLASMPNVRRLAAAGTRFTNYHANFAVCCPSRATTLTGQYAHNHGVWTNQVGYPALRRTARDTLPVWLRDAGYRTMLVGKYLHGYDADVDRVPPGWDRWRVPVKQVLHYKDAHLFQEDGAVHSYTGYKTDIYGKMALDLIRDSRETQPFFLWLAFNAPHSGRPVDPDDPTDTPVWTSSPAPRHRGMFNGTKAPAWGSQLFNERNVQDKPRHIRRLPRMSAQVRAAVHEAYRQQLESLQAVDEWVGRIHDALSASGRLANTLIVFSTDNGYYYGEHRIRAGKHVPYTSASRLPLVVTGPGFPSGAVDRSPRSNIDLAPTFVKAAGTSTRGRVMDGVPLTADVRPARPLLMEGRIPSGTASVKSKIRQFTALRTPSWFYARYRYTDDRSANELYDLRRDRKMLMSLDGRKGKRADLRAKMERMAGYRV